MLNKREIAEIQGVWDIGKEVFVDPGYVETTDVGYKVILSLYYVAPLIYISQTSNDCFI